MSPPRLGYLLNTHLPTTYLLSINMSTYLISWTCLLVLQLGLQLPKMLLKQTKHVSIAPKIFLKKKHTHTHTHTHIFVSYLSYARP